MSQQINLYSPLFRKQKKLFTARAMAQALGLVLVALAGFYGYARHQSQALQRQAMESGQQVKAGLERVKRIPGPAAATDVKALDQQIADLEAQLQANTQLLAQAEPSQGPREYLAPLQALARHRVDGVWLTEISLVGASGELSLTGKAAQAELVSRYIDRLAKDPALRGRRFSTLALERNDAPPAKGATPAASGTFGFRLLASPEGG